MPSGRLWTIDTKPLHILVVEDHDDSRTALTWLLNGFGHQVKAVSDADKALVVLSQTKVDVLLTDIMMPGCSGLELVRELKAADCLPPRVISMSILHEWDALPASRAAGCHAHLVKPFATGALTKALAPARASTP